MIEKFEKLEKNLSLLNLEREEVIHGTILALLANKNILYLGEPGIAKTQLAYHIFESIYGAKYFQYLMTKFTTPEEIFGPISINELKEGKFVRVSEGMIQDSHIVFLDEIFKSSSAILNSLLTILNERIYYQNGKKIEVPMKICIGSSNEIPEDSDGLQALQDRFTLKYLVSKIKEKNNFEKMLSLNETIIDSENNKINDKTFKIEPVISLTDIEEGTKAASYIRIPKTILDAIYEIRYNLDKEGVYPTDRIFKQSLSIIKAEAFLNKRDSVDLADLFVLKNILWNDPKDYKRVYLSILNVIDPLGIQISDLYDKAILIFEEYKNIKDKSKKIVNGLETANNLRDIRKKIIDMSGKRSVDQITNRETKNMISNIEKMLKQVHEEVTGNMDDDVSFLFNK